MFRCDKILQLLYKSAQDLSLAGGAANIAPDRKGPHAPAYPSGVQACQSSHLTRGLFRGGAGSLITDRQAIVGDTIQRGLGFAGPQRVAVPAFKRRTGLSNTSTRRRSKYYYVLRNRRHQRVNHCLYQDKWATGLNTSVRQDRPTPTMAQHLLGLVAFFLSLAL